MGNTVNLETILRFDSNSIYVRSTPGPAPRHVLIPRWRTSFSARTMRVTEKGLGGIVDYWVKFSEKDDPSSVRVGYSFHPE